MSTDPLAQQVGECHDSAGLLRRTGWQLSEIDELVASQELLGLRTSDGHSVYPVWQFCSDGSIVKGLEDVLPVLLDVMDPWVAARWFTAPDPRLDQMTGAEWLRQGRDVDQLRTLAVQDSAVLRS